MGDAFSVSGHKTKGKIAQKGQDMERLPMFMPPDAATRI